MSPPSFLLTSVRSTTVAALWLLVASCDSGVDEAIELKKLAQDCLVNSDCKSPLVCAFEVCHVACKISRDCDGGARCLSTDNPYRVCQLETERLCQNDRDCKTGLRCGVDGECRDACESTAQCIPGQVCVSGTCADQEELDESGRLPPASGVEPGGEGLSCVYASDCSGGLLCRDRTCLPECKDDRDCQAGTTCVESRCEPEDADPRACLYTSQCTKPGERCLGGICRCECLDERDCPDQHICDDCGCAPDPDRLPDCTYNSECKDGQVCRDGKCDPSCGDVLSSCDALCVDLKTDPQHCGDCETSCSAGQACRAGECEDLALAKSCWDLHLTDPTLPSGTYVIDPDGANRGSEKFATYCDMANDGGGWTLVLKADGAKPTFNYSQSIWDQPTPLNPESADLEAVEAKLDSYSRVPAGQIRLETTEGENHGALVLEVGEPSLFQALHRPIIGVRQTLQTKLTRAGWLPLFPGREPLGEGCALEGIDAENLDPLEKLKIGVRIGILTSASGDCQEAQAYFGIGGELTSDVACSSAPGPAVGGITGCGAGGAFSAFGYVFVRELPRSCREVKLRLPDAESGSYAIDVDGGGPLSPFEAHCDMTFDGGGWTLFFVQQTATGSSVGVPAPGGNAYLPAALVLELAQLSSQVHFRNAGQTGESITSLAGDYPIQNLRRGSVLNLGSGMSSMMSTVTGWSGPRAIIDYLWQGCREDELAGTYPTLYQACNNGEGISVDAGHAGWGFLADSDFEAYVR